jgi:hypothetical protein
MRLLTSTSIFLVIAISLAAAQSTRDPSPDPFMAAFPLAFDSEHIRLDIIGDSVEVHASYVLRCRAAGRPLPPLMYPFPEDSLMGGFRMISACMHAWHDSVSAPVRWEDVPGTNAVRLWLSACVADMIVTDVIYRQELHDDYARYIVTTTHAWGRPLTRASFDIRLPPGAIPIEFSFPFEPIEGTDRYRYEATDFMPDRDIMVRWRE